MHFAQLGEDVLGTFGLSRGCGRRRLSHKARRSWPCSSSTRAVLDARLVYRFEVEVWLGHAICIFSVCPFMLPVFSDVYTFTHALPYSRRLFSIVRSEVHKAMFLCFVAHAHL